MFVFFSVGAVNVLHCTTWIFNFRRNNDPMLNSGLSLLAVYQSKTSVCFVTTQAPTKGMEIPFCYSYNWEGFLRRKPAEVLCRWRASIIREVWVRKFFCICNSKDVKWLKILLLLILNSVWISCGHVGLYSYGKPLTHNGLLATHCIKILFSSVQHLY